MGLLPFRKLEIGLAVSHWPMITHGSNSAFVPGFADVRPMTAIQRRSYVSVSVL